MVHPAQTPGASNPPGSKAYRALREYKALNVEHFEGKLPSALVQRICSDSSTGYLYPSTTGGVSHETLSWDIAAGIVHGHQKNEALFTSWSGTGFMSLVDHAIQVGGYPVAVPLFGLDPELAEVVGMRDLRELAGAARLAVKETRASDIPNAGFGAKFSAGMAPALDVSLTVRKALLFASYPQFVPLIELIDDVDTEVLHASLQRLHGSRHSNAMTIGYVAALMVRAEREGLPLGECFRVWSLVPGETDLVLDAVRNRVPDEYLELLSARPRQ
jgi:hypothetical protein